MFEIGKLVRLDLGYQGENKARVIAIDMKAWLDEFPGAAVGIMLRRPDEDVYYPAALEIDDGIIEFEVSRSDVAIAGEGEAQIILTNDEDVELRSRVVKTKISPSLSGTEVEAPPPQQTWVSEVLQAAQGVEEAVDKMPAIGDNGNWWIWDADANEFVDSGYTAEGKEGPAGAEGPKGDRGDSGVYIGQTMPTDPSIKVWINPKGTGESNSGSGSGGANTPGGSGGAAGEDGGYYIPSVDEEKGILSWTPSKEGMLIVATAYIRGPKGEQGDRGEQGPQGEQGLQGEPGEKGDAGYTPTRGTDYWTDNDIAAIKAYVDDAILNGAW